jgi:methionyl-tRNA synthetase
MAKDNIPFHTVSFPCTIMGSGEDWKLVDHIKGFNWLTYYGGKFSTSQKRGIFMDQALEEFPADYYRYWLMAHAPESDDSSFTWQLFAGTVNKDLADVLGNFINRCLKFTKSKFGEQVPDGGTPGPAEQRLAADLDDLVASLTRNMEAMAYRKAMADLRAIWVSGNNYLAHAAPWTTVKEDRDAAAVAVRTGINLIRLFAVLSHPVIPATSAKLLECLGLDPADVAWPDRPMAEELARLPAGHGFTVPPILFHKIDGDRIEQLTATYGGDPELPAEPDAV